MNAIDGKMQQVSAAASPRERLHVFALLAAGALLSAWSIGAQFEPANLDNDVAQHLSVARNLLDGHGLSTSLLFYDEHYLQNRLPAAQTIWPPGHPLLLAALLALGVPAFSAVLLLGAAAHTLGGLLLYRIGRTAGLSPWPATFVGLAWLGCTTELGLIVRGYTEPIYVAATLAGTWAWVSAYTARTPRQRCTWLLAAGAGAGLALLTRYAGIAFIAAIVATAFAVTSLRERNVRAALRDAACAAAVPAGVLGALVVRNWLVTRTLTGWPHVQNAPDPVGAVRAAYWALQDLVGGADGWSDIIGYAIQIVLAAGVAVLLVAGARRGPAAVVRALGASGASTVALALAYIVITGTMLIALAASRYPELLGWRYLVPLLPFGLLAFVVAAEALLRQTALRSRARLATGAALGLWLAAFAIGQVRSIDVALDNDWLEARARTLAGALEQRVGNGRLGDVLRREASLAAPVLSNEGQGLGNLIGRPTLSLSPLTYANMLWDEPAVRRLVERYCVRWVVFFPSLFDGERKTNSNRPFFAALARRSPPPWLQLAGSSEHADVYRATLPCRRGD